MKLSTVTIAAIIGGVILLVTVALYRNRIESVVMPGHLAQAHAKYENECSKCHSAFKKELQNSLCLECHKDVSGDINAHEGFHGHIVSIEDKKCKLCHPDHLGSSFNIARLDMETFKHDVTDFPLRKAHARLSVACIACHPAGKKYRDAPKDCFSCHAKDDRHKGQLGKNCMDCHNESTWRETYFDHGKTHFPLTGKHQKAACNACHANETYKNTPIDCAACHLINDIHDSPKNEHCDHCHTVEGWKTVKYDHDKETKFMLKGHHVQVPCNSCHVDNVFKTKIGMQCIDCHKVDDVHKGKNGVKCTSCHSDTDWKKIAFDHNRDTHFKISGRHTKAVCEACHKATSVDMKIDATCISCHQADDVHKGQEGANCRSCHNDNGWREGVTFDHDLGRFPLIGQHVVVACAECHQSQAYKDAKMDCISCHGKDDFHKKTLGANCAICHNPNGWKLWEFDHDTQTQYKLEGPHVGLKCQACHKEPMGQQPLIISRTCVACHETDDVHKGQFGEDCEQCHAVDSFKNYSIGRKTR